MSRAKAPAVETTHKAEQELGPGVVNGRLIWTSASGLTKIDTESTGGCARRWFYEQVLGKRKPSTAAQIKGTKLHAEIEGHLIEGKPLLTPLALAGRHLIDERGPGIFIEAPLAQKRPDGSIASYLVTSAGVMIAGHVDLWNLRGRYLDKDGELRVEPRANTLETKDWKTTSDFGYAKSPAELATNVQMVTYAEVGFRAWSHLEHARLTHVAFLTRGSPDARLATTLCDREQIRRRWEYVEGLARLAADVARETDADKVPYNRNACSAYGGCPHSKYCSIGSHDSLADVFGPRGAAEVLARMRGETAPTQENVMSLVDKMNPAVLAAAQAGASLAPPQVQPMPPAAGVGVQVSMAPAVDAEVARLQAEETARRAQHAAGIPVGFAEALNALQASGYGHPSFVGRAAAAVSAHFGWNIPAGQGIQGTGWLAERVKNPVEDPSLLLQLAAEVATLPPLAPPAPPPTMVAAPSMIQQAPAPVASIAPVAPIAQQAPPVQQPAPAAQYVPPPAAPVQYGISVLPPDAPASNPALAAQPVDGFDNAKARELAALTAPPMTIALDATAAHVAATGQLPTPPPSLLTGGAPPQAPAPAAYVPPAQPAAPIEAAPQGQAPAPVDQTQAATPTPAKKGPGRPRGPRKRTTTTVAEQVGDVSRTVETSVETDDGTLNVYANAIPSGGFDRLEPYVELACQTLCDQFQAADIQCGPKDGPLGYDKWKGALKALVRTNPPIPGHYVVKSNGNDPAAVVIDALRSIIESSGGQLVEGVAW